MLLWWLVLIYYFGRAMLVVCPSHVLKVIHVPFVLMENRSFGTFISNKFAQCLVPFVPFHCGSLVQSLTMLSARNTGSHSLHPGCLL